MSISFKGYLNIVNTPMSCAELKNSKNRYIQRTLGLSGVSSSGFVTNAKLVSDCITNLSNKGIGYEVPLTGEELFFRFVNPETEQPAAISKKNFNYLLSGFNAAKNSDADVDLNLYA